MIDELARALGRRPPLRLTVPVLTPGLSSLWIGLVTPVDAGVARPLVEGLAVETVVTDPSGMALFPEVTTTPLPEALHGGSREPYCSLIKQYCTEIKLFGSLMIKGDKLGSLGCTQVTSDGGAATKSVDLSRAQVRAGGLALSVLADPAQLPGPRALSERPMRLAELRKRDRSARPDDPARTPRQPDRARGLEQTPDAADAIRGRERAGPDGAGAARRRRALSTGWDRRPMGRSHSRTAPRRERSKPWSTAGARR